MFFADRAFAVTADQLNADTLIALEKSASIKRQLPSVLGDDWLLPNFVVGPGNRGVSYLFDEATVTNLAGISPVVFCGEKGVGKSALAITLAVRWARISRSRPLLFTTGSAFAADYAAAVEIDDISSFRAKHRSCKLLVLDSLDPLLSKPAAQEELSHTIDALAIDAAPVIVTASQLPAAQSGIRPSLASRLSSGFSLPLSRPCPAATLGIVNALAERSSKKLPVTDLVKVCRSLDQPLKAAEIGSVVKVAEQNIDEHGQLDLVLVSQLARQLFSSDALTIQAIARLVARKMRVKLTDMRGSTREASIVRARGVAILLARKLTPCSLQEIGQFFGGRDHSTVLHAFRKTTGLADSDLEISTALAEIQAQLLR